MELLRKIFRIPMFLLWFAGSPLICRLVNRGPAAPERALTWTLVWAKVAAWIFNLKIRVVGEKEGFPGGLIAANHQSCLDILVLAATFKLRFSPKIEMRSWPVIGFMTGCNYPVWIDRSTPGRAKRSLESMAENMRKGVAMMVFPEGTVSCGKEGLLPFKSTSFQAVIDSGKKVLPVIISYDEKCRPKVQWMENTGFLSHVWRLLGLKETGVTVYIMQCMAPETNEDRKSFALRTHDVMDKKWRSL